jgi:hypothetical protein
LGYTGSPRAGAVGSGVVDRRYSTPDHLSGKPRLEPGYTLTFSCKDRTSQIRIQSIDGYTQGWWRFEVKPQHRHGTGRRASSAELAKQQALSGIVRKLNGKNNVIKKSAGHSGRPPSSTGRHRKEKILTSPVYIGDRNLHCIEAHTIPRVRAQYGRLSSLSTITSLSS